MEKVVNAIGPGLVSSVVVQSIRSFLNIQLKDIRPSQVVQAIRDDSSLWDAAGTNITTIAGNISPSMINAGRPMYRKAICDHGNATGLVTSWMKVDNPTIHSLILNTPGGKEWFDRQVREVCGKLKLEYEVDKKV